MAVLVAGIDVAKVSVENEFRIGVLESLVDLLFQRSGMQVSAAEIQAIRQRAFEKLRAKYPDMTFRLEPGPQG